MSDTCQVALLNDLAKTVANGTSELLLYSCPYLIFANLTVSRKALPNTGLSNLLLKQPITLIFKLMVGIMILSILESPQHDQPGFFPPF